MREGHYKIQIETTSPLHLPYAIMPFGMGLFLFRIVQATVRIYTGENKTLIVSHEAEEAIEDVKHMNAGD